MEDFTFDNYNQSRVNIKVIGVGGGGNNAVNRMVASDIRGVDFIAVNTDAQALNYSNATKKITIGDSVTGGKGAGANPGLGRQAAEESIDKIREVLEGSHMVFVTTGMGGGTGTGAAPIIAKLAKDMGILTVGIVTKPFSFEGRRRMLQAEKGIEEITPCVDSLIVIPNERLKQVSETSITLFNAFEVADEVLLRGVSSVSSLINSNGYINLDFADVTSVMKDAGYAHMGIGEGTGENKAEQAAYAAISSPLLETSIEGATGVLVNITVSPDTSLDDVEKASNIITEGAHPDANIIWGTSFDPDLENAMRVTIIATGFDRQKPRNDDDFYSTPKLEVVREPIPDPIPDSTPVINPVPEQRAIPQPQEPAFNYQKPQQPSYTNNYSSQTTSYPQTVTSPSPADAGLRDEDFDELVNLLKKNRH